MPKKKQPPVNAYFLFMMDYKKRPGNKSMTMKDVSLAASSEWEVRKLSVSKFLSKHY